MLARDKAFDPVTFSISSRMTALVRGMTGDHRGAVADLEKIAPLARLTNAYQPQAYFEYLNSLAVELGEVGRLDEARRASEIAVASPFASIYPAWRETFDEIALKQRRTSRSSLAVLTETDPPRAASALVEPALAGTRKGEGTNLLHLPASQRESEAVTSVPPLRTKGRVINLQQWKAQTQTPAHLLPGKLTPENRATMTTGEKLIRLMDLISRDETDDEMIDRILDAVEAIVLDHVSEKP